MTRVDFYHDAADARDVAARLAQKGVTAGLRIIILVADEAEAALTDQALWTFSPTAFVPHALAHSPQAAHSPVLIHVQNHLSHVDSLQLQKKSDNATFDINPSGKNTHEAFQLLINLSGSLPDKAEIYERVIEIVTHDEHNKAAARERYKAYRDLGFELKAHRLGQTND